MEYLGTSNNTVVSYQDMKHTEKLKMQLRFCLICNHTCNHGWNIVIMAGT